MTVTQRNITANFAGQAVTILCSLIFLPLYLPLLGTEAYGLVGFHTALATIFALLDFGLGTAASREAARRASFPEHAPTIAHLLRTMEWIYWLAAALTAAGCWWVSPWLASHWLHLDQLTPATATNCLRLLGLGLALRLPSGLYAGVLNGLHRQVSQNVLRMVVALLGSPGAYFLLKHVSRQPETYFLWQVAIAVLSVGAVAVLTWRALPIASPSATAGPGKPRFALKELRGIAQFAAGSTAIAVLSLVLTNTDRFLLSTMVPLASFGIYTVAINLNGYLAAVMSNVTTVLLPRFCELEARGEHAACAQLLHRATQAVGLLLLPLAGLLITRMDDLLFLWLRNPALLAASDPARWLIAGSVLNAFCVLPYLLLLAKGNTRFTIVQNLIAISLHMPLLYGLIRVFGIAGGGMGWLALNLGYYVVSNQFIFRQTLPTEKNRWLVQDTALPLLSCAAIFAFFHWLGWPSPAAALPVRLLVGFAVYLLAVLTLIAISPETRAYLFSVLWVRRYVGHALPAHPQEEHIGTHASVTTRPAAGAGVATKRP